MGQVGQCGSIPAHAGKAGVEPDTNRRIWVDPRARGEGCSVTFRNSSWTGRSPRTRGRHAARECDQLRLGSIPAHAGKATPQSRARWFSGVDPRARGEGSDAVLRPCSTSGRSPRTRGRRQRHMPDVLGLGSIPAHAGKAPNARMSQSAIRVDPRARGEGPEATPVEVTFWGRSPRTRGRRGHGAENSR